MSTRKDLTSFFKSKIFAFVIRRVLTMITQTAGSKVDIFCAKGEAFFVRKVKQARFFPRISKRTKPIDHFRVTLVPLFQNESTCKTYHTKRSLVCKKMKLLAEDIFIHEWFVLTQRPKPTRKWPISPSLCFEPDCSDFTHAHPPLGSPLNFWPPAAEQPR